jgi:hypothetical protein
MIVAWVVLGVWFFTCAAVLMLCKIAALSSQRAKAQRERAYAERQRKDRGDLA